MRQLIDFIPILAFVSVFFLFDDIYLATLALMIGASCQILIEKIFFKNVKGGNQGHLRCNYHLRWTYNRATKRCIYQMEANDRKLVVWFCPCH